MGLLFCLGATFLLRRYFEKMFAVIGRRAFIQVGLIILIVACPVAVFASGFTFSEYAYAVPALLATAAVHHLLQRFSSG